MKKIISTNIGLVIICLFTAVCVMADFIVIDKALDSYVVNNKTEEKYNNSLDEELEINNDSELEEKNDYDYCNGSNLCDNKLVELLGDYVVLDDSSNIRTVFDRISIDRYSMYSDVNVDNGKLIFNFYKYLINSSFDVVVDNNSVKTISYEFPDEKVKYIYTLYFQPSGDTMIYVLTDNNNLYQSTYNHLYEDSDDYESLTDFKLMYSNVSEIKILPNDCSNDQAGMCKPDGLYANINGENISVRLVY